MIERHLLILDGYNIINAFPDLRRRLSTNLESARDGLYALVSDWRRQHPAWEVLVVYDGQGAGSGMAQNNRGRTGGVKTIFTVSAVEADERIKEAIRKQDTSTETVVITRDREILACCRDHRVRFESPEFLTRSKKSKDHRLTGEADPTTAKEKNEISNWYKDALKNQGVI